MATATVAVTGLQHRYGSEDLALAGISFTVPPGEVFCLLGPNGAGKSTLTRILATLLRPTAGEVWVAGRDAVRDPGGVRRRIGVALQDASVDPLLTGREQLLMLARLYRLPAPVWRKRLAELAERLALMPFWDRRIGTYSGGMRRRLDLAVALLTAPAVLLLDEPTVGLDPETRRAVWALVRHLPQEAGTTVVLTTQDLEEADALADRVAILVRGRMVTVERPAALKRQLRYDRVTVTLETAAAAAAAAAHLRAAGWAVEVAGATIRTRVESAPAAVPQLLATLDAGYGRPLSLQVTPPTLEDAFLQIVQAPTGLVSEGGHVPCGASRG